jgi:uncharacterized protein YprB with RNaseH-like and TPR domain
MPEALHERLRRLRRTEEPAPRPAAPTTLTGDLERLEESLLGERAPLLSLKERLQRLVAVAERRVPSSSSARPALEDVAPGRPMANARGEFFLSEVELPIDHLHGDVALSRLRSADAENVRILAGDLDIVGFDLADTVFLDTETTGLAGGSGTAAFLIGVGFVDGDRFRVRQYFMRDYHEEPAQLLGLAADLARFSSIVTFNGKMFDLPLLEARFALQRARFPLDGAPHLDLLHPARRLWKARLESCRLQSLESALLCVRRNGDVPGEEIPRIYFDYVRRRDPRALARIFHHNRLDILSLAALSALACQWVREGGWAEDPRDIVSLGRVLERAQLYDRSEEEYRRAAQGDAVDSRRFALLKLAARARREGAHETAVELWHEAASAGEWTALRQIAIHHEHKRRDLHAALAAVDRALSCASALDARSARRAFDDLGPRRERLLRKLDGAQR